MIPTKISFDAHYVESHLLLTPKTVEPAFCLYLSPYISFSKIFFYKPSSGTRINHSAVLHSNSSLETKLNWKSSSAPTGHYRNKKNIANDCRLTSILPWITFILTLSHTRLIDVNTITCDIWSYLKFKPCCLLLPASTFINIYICIFR